MEIGEPEPGFLRGTVAVGCLRMPQARVRQTWDLAKTRREVGKSALRRSAFPVSTCIAWGKQVPVYLEVLQ